jgi:hypothetical protein
VGFFDGPASGIKEIAVQDHAHYKGKDDPFAKERVLQTLQYTVNYVSADVASESKLVVCNRRLGVVNRRELKLILDRHKNGDNS